MKQFIRTLWAAAILCTSTLACAQASEKFKPFNKDLNGVSFSVDPRIELFHTIEVLNEEPLVNYIDIDYKQKIAAGFAPFKNHELFVYLKQKPLYGKIFTSIDAPIWFMLQLTSDFEWRKDIPLDSSINTPALDSLRVLIQKFSAESNYPKFFNSNGDLYTIALNTLTYNLPEFDEKNRLMNYCGASNKKGTQFNVILNFLGWGNFGPRFFKKSGAEMYAVIAPEKSAIRVPTFDVQALYKLLWHEFAHSFANPAVEQYQSQFDALSHLWEPVRENMKAQAYHSWPSVMKEHLTEAIACRMAASKFGEDAAELNYLRKQRGLGWIYLNPIVNALKFYESNRETFPTLVSFMPKLLETMKTITPADINRWLSQIKEVKKPEVQAIPTVGKIYYQNNILIILPTGETDKQADQLLKAFITNFKDRVGPLRNATVVDDTTALKMELAPYNLSVWGTPNGNLFLKKYISEIPLLIKEDRIIGEHIYMGTGYGVLIGWVNPLNPQNVMAIYTAQNPATLIDFNKIMNGGGNYHIFKNYVTQKMGEFQRQGGVWMAK